MWNEWLRKTHNQYLRTYRNTYRAGDHFNEAGESSYESYAHTYTSLCTIPMIVKCSSKRMKMHALLDDASEQRYIHADIIQALCLNGPTKQHNVCVVNGQVNSFELMQFSFGIECLDGGIGMEMHALTSNQVTGDMQAVDWQFLKI